MSDCVALLVTLECSFQPHFDFQRWLPCVGYVPARFMLVSLFFSYARSFPRSLPRSTGRGPTGYQQYLPSSADRAYRAGVATVDLRTEIKKFLSTRRARITPERAGLPAYGGNRRG